MDYNKNKKLMRPPRTSIVHRGGRRCRPPRYPKHVFFRAVLNDDLRELKRLLVESSSSNNLLTAVAELIEKGADVHLTDDFGFTFLHLAAKSKADSMMVVGQLIIEKGANINQQGHNGTTPLYCACQAGNFDWVCMLLYYGADVTISSDEGILPLAVVSQDLSEEQQLQLQEILFNYTFSEDKITIRLGTLVAAMTLKSGLFPKILDKISHVTYDMSDLEHLVSSLIYLIPRHLKLFIEKFGYIIEDLIVIFQPMDKLIKIASRYGIQELKNIFDTFLNSDHSAEFIQSSDLTTPKILHLLEMFSNRLNEEEFTQMICVMLTYGLTVTSSDVDAVYHHYGYCELFKILLHMDVIILTATTIRNGQYVILRSQFNHRRFYK